MNYKSPETEFNRFRAITSGLRWMSVEELVDHCDREGFWSDEMHGQPAKVQFVRTTVRQAQEHLIPLWAKLLDQDEESGETERLYKQVQDLDRDDLEILIDQEAAGVGHHKRRAKVYQELMKRKYGRTYVPSLNAKKGDEEIPW